MGEHFPQGSRDEDNPLGPSPFHSLSPRSSAIFEPLDVSPFENGYDIGAISADGIEMDALTRCVVPWSAGEENLSNTYYLDSGDGHSINNVWRDEPDSDWTSPLIPRQASSKILASAKGKQSTAADADNVSVEVPDVTKKRRYSGWRVGVIASACMSALVFLLNTSLTIWASRRFPTKDNGFTVLITGDCNKTRSWGFWIHLAINVLSTTLLAASNYTMQCLLAPTRSEVDTAHNSGKWLVIGVPSIRNVTRIKAKRASLYILLIMTSLPLHLLYNSAIFETTTGYSYSTFVVSEQFLNGSAYNGSINDLYFNIYDNYLYFGDLTLNNTSITKLQTNVTKLQRLSPEDCMAAYSNEFVTDRSDVLAVTTSAPVLTDTNINTPYIFDNDSEIFLSTPFLASNSSVYGFTIVDIASSVSITMNYAAEGASTKDVPDPLMWICEFSLSKTYATTKTPCDIQLAETMAANWTIFNQPIAYCLSYQEEGLCTLEFSETIMMIVILCNIAKTIFMMLAVWKPTEEVLVTVGDAAASFLRHPDPTTKGLCLITNSLADERTWQFSSSNQNERTKPKCLSRDRKLWRHSPSAGRWILTMMLCVPALITSASLLAMSINTLSSSGSSSLTSLWNMGFGAINSRSIIQFGRQGSLIEMILLANTPQIILSLTYFMYNAIYSQMVSANEWHGFSKHRKTLRVGSPRGQQRSTYFLSLPYRYSIPLIMASASLHWLVSQSIFLVSIIIRGPRYANGDPDLEDKLEVISCGWSSIAIIFVIALGSLMVLTAVGMGFRKLDGSMPLGANCSFVISAACHPPATDKNASLLPVKWGALGGVGEGEGEVGHCTLTSEEVVDPVVGRSYA